MAAKRSFTYCPSRRQRLDPVPRDPPATVGGRQHRDLALRPNPRPTRILEHRHGELGRRQYRSQRRRPGLLICSLGDAGQVPGVPGEGATGTGSFRLVCWPKQMNTWWPLVVTGTNEVPFTWTKDGQMGNDWVV